MSVSYLSHVADHNCHDDSVDGDSFTEDDAGRRYYKKMYYYKTYY